MLSFGKQSADTFGRVFCPLFTVAALPLSYLCNWAEGVRSMATSSSKNTTGDVPEGSWLVVGLGNPGSLHARSRHNIGFEVVEQFASVEGLTFGSSRHKAHLAKGRYCGRTVLVAKPQTYMNLSGDSVSSLMRYFKISRDRLLVVYDDLDTEVGSIKLKPTGGHGGHNGMRSIVERLGGSKDFARIKVGIGRPPSGRMGAASYVLARFPASERGEMDMAVTSAAEMIRTVLSEGTAKAMNQHNHKPKRNL